MNVHVFVTFYMYGVRRFSIDDLFIQRSSVNIRIQPGKKTLPASISNVKFVEHTPPEVTETRQAKTKLIMNQINHEPE